jgi:hypothetical protein
MSGALRPAKSGSVSARKQQEATDARDELLSAANINPRTGLATDYLNHFNEAIMLLEMIPDIPECAEDFIAWRPRSYREHFQTSHLKAHELIIQTYDEADPCYRAQFDRTIDSMTSILLAVNDGMRAARDDKRVILARHAADWVKPLLVLADELIHGSPEMIDITRIMEK